MSKSQMLQVIDDFEAYLLDLVMTSKNIDIIAYENLKSYLAQLKKEILADESN